MADKITANETLQGNSLSEVTGSPTTGDKYSLDVAIKEAVALAFTPSGLTVGGKITEVALNSSTWTALPTTAYSGRNGMGFQNASAIEVKINFDNGVGTFTGWSVKANGEFFLDVSDSVIVYAKSASGTPTLLVMEVA